MTKFPAIAAIAFSLSACATKPEKIEATYVSPTRYASLSCEQMDEEFREVQSRSNMLFKKQRKQSKNDKIATGVGLVVFWPALFFLMDDDQKEEVAQIKGEYAALEIAHDKKGCLDTAFAKSREEAKKAKVESDVDSEEKKSDEVKDVALKEQGA